MSHLHFPRAAVAQDIARAVLGQTFFASSTLFLSAPRRTGKSRFLCRDVMPQLEALGACVIYVDLWKDKQADPRELIAHAIARKLAERQGLIRRAASAVGLAKVSIHGVEFDITAVGQAAGATLSDALEELHRSAAAPVVLIVDEAQQVISNPQAMTVMFALKSARDTLNANGNNLGLILSGSDRDKLLRLVSGNEAPFLGSTISPLPVLGKEFTDYLAGQLRVNDPALPIDNARLFEAFARLDHRPEFLIEAIKDATGAFSGPAEQFHQRLDAAASKFQQETHAKYAATYNALSPVQQGLLTRILAAGKDGAEKLFTNEALLDYARRKGKGDGKPLSAGSARLELNKLRDMDPPVVWKSSRGDYAAEDSGMARWYAELASQGAWPPR